MDTGSSLTARQWRAVEALAEGCSFTEAALIAGVGPRRLYEWRQQPAFRSALDGALVELHEQVRGRLEGLADLAVDRLREVLEDGDDRVAVRAALGLRARGCGEGGFARVRPTGDGYRRSRDATPFPTRYDKPSTEAVAAGLSAPQWGQAGSPGCMTPLHSGQVTGSAALCGSFPQEGHRVAPTTVSAPHVAQTGRLAFLLASPSRAATTTPIGPSNIPRINPVPARFFELETAAPRKPHTSIPIPSHVQSIAVSSFGSSIYMAPRPRGEPRTFFVDAP